MLARGSMLGEADMWEKSQFVDIITQQGAVSCFVSSVPAWWSPTRILKEVVQLLTWSLCGEKHSTTGKTEAN